MRAQATTYTLGTTNLALGPAAGTNSACLTVTPKYRHLDGQHECPLAAFESGQPERDGQHECDFQLRRQFEPDPHGHARHCRAEFHGHSGRFHLCGSRRGDQPGARIGLSRSALWRGDGAGNVFFSDFNEEKIEKWSATSNTVTTLATYASGVGEPRGVAVDSADNVYVADSYNAAIDKWTATNNSYAPLISSGLAGPVGVAVDATGNVYIADATAFAIKKWTATNHIVTTLPIDELGRGLQDLCGFESVYATHLIARRLLGRSWGAAIGMVAGAGLLARRFGEAGRVSAWRCCSPRSRSNASHHVPRRVHRYVNGRLLLR